MNRHETQRIAIPDGWREDFDREVRQLMLHPGYEQVAERLAGLIKGKSELTADDLLLAQKESIAINDLARQKSNEMVMEMHLHSSRIWNMAMQLEEIRSTGQQADSPLPA